MEGLRSRLKLPAARGWLAPVPGGLFTVPEHAGKRRNRDGKGFFSLGPEVPASPDLRKEEPFVAAYAAVPAEDPFAVSNAMSGALAAGLAGPAAAGLTACELEELPGEGCRQAVRQLPQDHHGLRAVREEQQAREQRPLHATAQG